MALLAPPTGVPLRRAQVAGAASAWAAEQLNGPERLAPVVHVGRDAVYVDLAGSAVGVLSRHATHVPCGIRTGLPGLAGIHGIGAARVGDTAVVGEGRLLLHDVETRVCLTVTTKAGPVHAPAALRTALVDNAVVHRVRADLPAHALALLGAGDPAAVAALLGLGGGLTPLGDDVLAGWLATTAALGRQAQPVGDRVGALAPTATTTLSATLLACARRGDVLPEFRRLLATRTGSDTARALGELLRVGHSSGAGLALGCLLALPADDRIPA
ncbi:DUF2877 domain-containing protein [Nocardioides sp.]|uniref:oxamate carbamoyltransferase subunit AllH family protein n=1 Tax=Nocardioides sp. TaxID=35761 RepID=UPI002734FCA7|nr:DUF2877 domain-containing protein [Nocardioides sp.]MDP3892361.1 DUF2877 domain-containing protein [Nocardioides sp.]